MPKVFVIGFNKCGTSSMCQALKMLGYHADHFSTQNAVKRAIQEKKPPLHYVKTPFNAYTDNCWISYNFELLDKHYPGSKFILLTRNMEDWLKSRKKHVLRNRKAAAKGEYKGGWLKIEEKKWIRNWNRYHPRVKKYFKNRPKDLLIIDVCKGEGFDKLCSFLGKKKPNAYFPRENITKK